MATTLVEAVESAIIGKLKAGMPSKIAALNAEYADGITLESIPDASYWPCEMDDVVFPAVFVIAGDSDFEDQSTNLVANHTLDIVVACSEADTSILSTRVKRYIRAIFETLKADRMLGGSAMELKFRRLSYKPMFTDATGVYVKDAYLTIEVEKEEF